MTLTRILCIDDETDILEIAKMSLETVGGFTVKTCSRGMEGIEQADSFKPDMILLDVMMPGLDGPATLKILQAKPALKNVPIIFMTAKVQPSEIANYLSVGAAGVIAKPFDPMTLPQEVKSRFEAYHAKR
jgi:two-component system, OmpR family, response regulator